MYLTWPSFNNIRLLLMACMPVVIFYLVWLINTSVGIRAEEGTLLDLVCWPDGNVIPVIIACASLVAVFIEVYGLYQLFKAGLPKQEYNVTNGLFYYVLALVTMMAIFLLIIFYSGIQTAIIRAKIKGGITKAMLRYASHLPSKVAIDRLQTKFNCCGRVNFSEWFYIPWHDSSKESAFGNEKFIADNVPYSCCSLDIMWPCIHHGVMQKGVIYKYSPETRLTIWPYGCEEKLISEMTLVSWKFNAVMFLIIMAMVLQVIGTRYLHTAYRNGLNIDNQITSEAYLLRSETALETRPYNTNIQYKRVRTTQWVTNSIRSVRRTSRYNSSDTDRSSSDMLLKPIYE